MMNFFKKITGQKAVSGCCGVEIKEVQHTEGQKEDSCCGSSSEEKNEYCCS
ncbi:hypothetical protein [Neobacillus terrae]|uniref:hypothetical protein n=1 Tax=Neobacillus terrae TaxID=3034837 RepID=UPI00140AD74E|nr:hypothetical protein [Neobacillus terrae]NHM32026.1 hypothetical protein [Neobacillus terrae]